MKMVSVNGTKLAAVDRGSGMPVLFVHGFPLDHSMWDAQISALADRYRVIAPDLHGFGQSDVLEGTVGMERFADDLATLLGALGISQPIVLCGLSMGGYIAFQFWKRHPEILRALILCDTRAAADTPEAAASRRETASRVLSDGPGTIADSMIPKLLAPDTLQGRPDIANALRRVMLNNNPKGIAAASRGMAERPDFSEQLEQIRCPALVLVGSQDSISTVGEMRSMARKIPGAKFVSIEGAGHMSPVERPAEVSAAIAAFLAELRESGTATGS